MAESKREEDLVIERQANRIKKLEQDMIEMQATRITQLEDEINKLKRKQNVITHRVGVEVVAGETDRKATEQDDCCERLQTEAPLNKNDSDSDEDDKDNPFAKEGLSR